MKRAQKRIISLILLMSLLLNAVLNFNILAENTSETNAQVQITETSAQPGSTVEINVSLVNNPGVY